ncbi:serine hydrolase [Actinomycetospora sp. TBRC 11914]|uniref:serine hydrolase domain-containing protein n=1 Tax=Actinomycetospora sp. TBRC 11914 TaxID=2729387 RepID=UPI00145E89A4|nr:serine hydrolase domain-containing protein [Actinomycetospora sp. TBRC 11914]NMO93987.1 beta-lactamase family protein [Actinomycetospora sp. TBRC 11914]
MTTAPGTSWQGLGDLAAGALADDLPGLVVLAAHGGEVHVEARGTLALGGAPVARDSLFRIASLTKPIVAAAVGTLLADGLLSLDEPVDRLLPELADRRVLRRPDAALDDTVPAHRPISVRDVLTYTCGWGQSVELFTADPPWPIATAMGAGRLNTMGPPRPDVPPEPDAWLAELAELPLIAQPGERWLYNTSGQLLGVLAARAADEPLPDLLRSRILAPLGMTDTAFTGDPARLATAYEAGAVWDAPDGRWSAPPRFPDGAAGLVSSADDLLAFARMLLDDGAGVVPPEYVAAMTADQLTPAQRAGSGFLDDGTSWGYGVSVTITGQRAGAFGWAGGLGTTWHVDPARDLVVVTLTQRLLASPDDFALHAAVVDAADAAVG